MATKLGNGFSARWDGMQAIIYRQYKNGTRPIGYLAPNLLIKLAGDAIQRYFHKGSLKAPARSSIPDTIQAASGGNLTQCQKLLRHFRNGRSITRYQAMVGFGIAELSSRVGEINRQLAKEGDSHRVVSEWIKTPQGKRVKKYYLGAWQ